MIILIFLYLFLFHSFYLIIKKGNIPIIYIPLLVFSIVKTTLDYRICSVAYFECKLRGVKREESYMNQFLDPIVDVRYTNHAYPLFIMAYFVIFISSTKYLKKYIID